MSSFFDKKVVVITGEKIFGNIVSLSVYRLLLGHRPRDGRSAGSTESTTHSDRQEYRDTRGDSDEM